MITTEPADKSAFWGDRVTLAVAATGTAPLTYQWHFNGAPLAGRTNASLVRTNVTFADAGAYFVTASDSGGSVTSRVATLNVPAPAVLDPKLGANLRLGDDPAALPSDRRAQAEPHIARSPIAPSVLVATFQESRREDGAAVAGGYAISTNGGLNWSRALIPKLTRLTGGTHHRAGDSVAAFDLHGNVYLSHIVFTNATPPPTGTVISKSTDGGATFADPVMVFSSRLETDKSWLAINTFAASPTAHRLAVMFNVFGDGKDQLHCTYSDDLGGTWSPPTLAGPKQGVFCQPFFLPDGSLGVVYFHYLNNLYETTAKAQIEFMRSLDGGQTFTDPIVITDMTGQMYHDPIARDAWDLPSAVTDRQAGVIYVTYQALLGSAPNRTPRILFTRSLDRGLTWSQPVAVNDTPNRGGVFNPCIAVSPDGQHVTIAFYDKRHNTAATGGNLVDYYLAESFDGGETWGPNLRLSDVTSDLRKAPLTGSGRMFADYQGIVPALDFDTPGVAVWIDTRTGNPDPYVARIQRTQGTTFGTWRKLRFSANDLANAAVSSESADPDADGIPNLAEYVFGLEPTRKDRTPLESERPATDTGETLTVRYGRLAVLADVVIAWESSSELTSWIPVTPLSEQITTGPDPSLRLVQASFGSATVPRFYRLLVSLRPPAP